MARRGRSSGPRFGRRRRPGRVLAGVGVLVAAAGVAASLLTPVPSDAVARLLGSDDPAAAAADPRPPTEPPPTERPSTEPSSPVQSATRAPGTTSPREQARVEAAPLVAPPQVDVATQLPVERPAPNRSLRRLGARLDAVVTSLAPSLAGTDVSIAVRDARGRRVYDRHAGRRMLPASTMKTVTAATVLATLGADHQFVTTVATTAPIRRGVVRGDLVLVGGGDPVLATEEYRTHVYPSRPSTSIEALADAVAEAGIRRVNGGLVADGSGWGNLRVAAGWRDSYLAEQDARRITRLTVDAGLTVDVEIPPDAPVQVELHPAPDPVQTAANVFAAELAERGISIRGKVTTSRLPVPTRRQVAAVASPPVSELLEFTLQRSDNHLADTMLLAAAYAATGEGSWAAANRVATAVLDGLGVPTRPLRVADGSGLSRLDRVSAAQLADLDVAMMASPDRRVWQNSLSVAGRTGTLRGRLRGTPADGRFYGKTGTLDDVKAVVGHVMPADGDASRRLHVAVVANSVPPGGRWAVAVLMDRLALELADHLDGCTTSYDPEGVPTRTCKAA